MKQSDAFGCLEVARPIDLASAPGVYQPIAFQAAGAVSRVQGGPTIGGAAPYIAGWTGPGPKVMVPRST